jgi:hypothetical protein
MAVPGSFANPRVASASFSMAKSLSVFVSILANRSLIARCRSRSLRISLVIFSTSLLVIVIHRFDTDDLTIRITHHTLWRSDVVQLFTSA